MNKLIKIPANYITGLLLVAPKKEVRYYLSSIHIGKNKVEATNGFMLTRIEIDNSDPNDIDDFIDIVINRTCLDSLMKLLTPKQKREEIITINVDDEVVTCCNASVKLELIDSPYPDTNRILKDVKETSLTSVGINTEVLAAIGKCHRLVTKDKGQEALKLSFTGGNMSIIQCNSLNYDFITSYIMPHRV